MLLKKYAKREIKVLMQFCRVFAQKVLAHGCSVAHCLKHILPGPYLITKSFHCNIVGLFQWGALILIFFFIPIVLLRTRRPRIWHILFSWQPSEKKLFWVRFLSFLSGPKDVTFLIKISSMISACLPK